MATATLCNHETLYLDGETYTDCEFRDCRMVYNGGEPPVFDGSSEQFVFLLECAGIAAQTAPRRAIEIRRPVRVSEGDAFAELRPGPSGLDMALSIDFAAAAIGRQALSLRLTPDSFRQELARA